LRKDNRPYYIKRFHQKFQWWYTEHFIKPQFNYLGRSHQFVNPWYLNIFGPDIRMGSHGNITAAKDAHVKLHIWGRDDSSGHIAIGDFVFIGPGVRITAYDEVNIGDNCLIASGVYITDSDWHGIYDRVNLPSDYTPVNIGNNVWIGDHATILKGVSIGENSIVGSGSVVTRDIAPNTIVAGNPAKVVKQLDPDAPKYVRGDLLSQPHLEEFMWTEGRKSLAGNSLIGWLWNIVKPSRDK